LDPLLRFYSSQHKENILNMWLLYGMKTILLQDKVFNIFAYELKVRITQLLARNLAFDFLKFLLHIPFLAL